MKFLNPMLVVTDMDKSVEFYKRVLGLEVVQDFGANKTLTGSLALQTADSFSEFIDGTSIRYGGNNAEMYFEEDDFDTFVNRLSEIDVEYVHPVKEHSWGQRVVRFYDPDHHIVEVGENMQSVVNRFSATGLSKQQIAERMDVPIEYVDEFLL